MAITTADDVSTGGDGFDANRNSGQQVVSSVGQSLPANGHSQSNTQALTRTHAADLELTRSHRHNGTLSERPGVNTHPQPWGAVTTTPLFSRRPSARRLIGLLLLTIAITGACTEAAYWYAAQQNEVWAAYSEIEYRGDSWVETAAVEQNSQSLTRPIADAYGLTMKDFDKQLTAGQVAGTQILRFEFKDENQDQALAIVTELTNTYLEAISYEAGTESLTLLDQTIVNLEADLRVAISQLRLVAGPPELPSSAEERLAEAEVNRILGLLADAQTKRLDSELTDIEAAENRPEIVTAPVLLDERVEPKPASRAALGFLGGLLLSILVAVPLLFRRPRS